MAKYENISLRPAQNGHILHYTKLSKPENTNSNFANSIYEDMQEVFEKGKEKEALARMAELHCGMEENDKDKD